MNKKEMKERAIKLATLIEDFLELSPEEYKTFIKDAETNKKKEDVLEKIFLIIEFLTDTNRNELSESSYSKIEIVTFSYLSLKPVWEEYKIKIFGIKSKIVQIEFEPNKSDSSIHPEDFLKHVHLKDFEEKYHIYNIKDLENIKEELAEKKLLGKKIYSCHHEEEILKVEVISNGIEEEFIKLVSDNPVYIFDLCLYEKCNRCIIITHKSRKYCKNRNCATLQAQILMRERDIDSAKEKDKIRKRRHRARSIDQSR